MQRWARSRSLGGPRRSRAALDRRNERVDPTLRLSAEQAVRIVEALRRGGARRTSDDRPAPQPSCSRQDVVHRRLLHQHAAGEHDVRPAQVFRPKRLHVLVDESQLPALRQQRCDRNQSERRQRGALRDERQTVLKSPVRRRKGRVDEEDTHALERCMAGATVRGRRTRAPRPAPRGERADRLRWLVLSRSVASARGVGDFRARALRVVGHATPPSSSP